MTQENLILNNKFMVSDSGELYFFKSMEDGRELAYCIGLEDESDIQLSIKVTQDIVYDCIHIDKSRFANKYENKLLPKAPLTIQQCFLRLRDFIADHQTPIPKGRKKSIRKDKIPHTATLKLSRREQVKILYESGITSPTKIAKELGTNAGYVSRLIKEIK